MEEPLVSFIFVNRGGINLLDAIRNVKEVYSDLRKEIIVIEQDDQLPFMRGQLFNIGVKLSRGEFLALSDNDIYHLRKVDWLDLYYTNQQPMIGWKYISQVKLSNGKAIVTSTNECKTGHGAFNFMKKTDFVKSNGFSNLFVGYGFEDIEYAKRLKFIRVPQNLGHITHPSHRNIFPKNLEYNRKIMNEFSKKIDPALDGMSQTTFKITSDLVKDNVRFVKVTDISVTENYKYRDILEAHYRFIKR